LQHFMNHAFFAGPVVVIGSIGENWNEVEVGKLGSEFLDLVHVKEVRFGPSAVKKPHGALLPAFDVILKNRPKWRHAGAATNQDQRSFVAFSSEAGAVRPSEFNS